MKLLVCIPTFNNPEFVKEILELEFQWYWNLDISLCIADSSNNDDTQIIVETYKEENDNLCYIRFPTDIQSNDKVYRIYQMVNKEFDCDYLWIRSDALRADELLLKSLPYYMSLEYDMIVTNYAGNWRRGIWETSDLQLFFKKYAWTCCLYGDVILRSATMLDNADWSYYTNKYLKKERMNFSHVCMYFEQLLNNEIERGKASILIMDIASNLYWGTPKKTKSAWHSDIFQIWLEYWPNAIEALPDYYTEKESAIQEWGKNEIYYSERYLAELEIERILSWEVYVKYKPRIKKYSGVPVERFEKAAKGYWRDNLPQWPTNSEEYIKLDSFCKKYKRIALYGCGRKARRYFEYLSARGVTIVCFLVSDKKKEKNEGVFIGHDVINISEFVFEEDIGIVLSLSKEYQEEVYPIIIENHLEKNTFAFPFLDYEGWGGENVLSELKRHVNDIEKTIAEV